MRVERHVALRTDSPDISRLEGAGLAFGDKTGIISSTQLYEDDPRWPTVAAILRDGAEQRARHPKMSEAERLDFAAAPSAHFSESERTAAQWLDIFAVWTNGYPQPEDEWKEQTFDLADYCPTCGTGGRQNAPYRMSKTPKWGKRWLAGLFWAPDALFVRRDVFEEVFVPRGVAGREVLLHKGSEPIPDAVQLAPKTIASLDASSLESHICEECGRVKYVTPRRTFFPSPATPVEGHAFLSEQWFGPGAMGSRALFLSQEIYQALRKLEGRQVRWHPCQPPNA